MNQPKRHLLVLDGVEDPGMQGQSRAVIGPDYSSLLVPSDRIVADWDNPHPVSVLLQPVINYDTNRMGLVIGRRAIEPHKGKWALPGGFMLKGETPERAAMREFCEEMAMPFDVMFHGQGHIYDLRLAGNGNLLIFCVNPVRLMLEDVRDMKPTAECSGARVIYEPEPLAFDTHTSVVERWFGTHLLRETPQQNGFGCLKSEGGRW